jgi:ammonium transporter, Amt family
MPPHNLGYTLMGASMLWVGWFGFNAGSAVAANESAGMAMLVTQVATAAAALAWMFSEWFTHGKPSVLGIATGAVAGLVAITPASGTAGPLGALAIGAASGIICFLASTKLKRALGYDDSLDVFGVHAVGGIVGAILTGVFVSAALGGAGLAEGMSMLGQVWIQTKGRPLHPRLHPGPDLHHPEAGRSDDRAAGHRGAGNRGSRSLPARRARLHPLGRCRGGFIRLGAASSCMQLETL